MICTVSTAHWVRVLDEYPPYYLLGSDRRKILCNTPSISGLVGGMKMAFPIMFSLNIASLTFLCLDTTEGFVNISAADVSGRLDV